MLLMTAEGTVYAPYWACRQCNVIPLPTVPKRALLFSLRPWAITPRPRHTRVMYICADCGSQLIMGVGPESQGIRPGRILRRSSERVPIACSNPDCRYFGRGSIKTLGWSEFVPEES